MNTAVGEKKKSQGYDDIFVYFSLFILHSPPLESQTGKQGMYLNSLSLNSTWKEKIKVVISTFVI